eukprot:10291448-Lingulodinium_polyedra.AAC.1
MAFGRRAGVDERGDQRPGRSEARVGGIEAVAGQGAAPWLERRSARGFLSQRRRQRCGGQRGPGQSGAQPVV